MRPRTTRAMEYVSENGHGFLTSKNQNPHADQYNTTRKSNSGKCSTFHPTPAGAQRAFGSGGVEHVKRCNNGKRYASGPRLAPLFHWRIPINVLSVPLPDPLVFCTPSAPQVCHLWIRGNETLLMVGSRLVLRPDMGRGLGKVSLGFRGGKGVPSGADKNMVQLAQQFQYVSILQTQ